MRTLVLLIPQDLAAPVPWALFEAPLNTPVRAGVATGVLEMSADRVWALAPGTDATVHTVELPADANTRRIAAAAAFALEDHLAVDPGELHFALGAPAADKRFVAVASHDAMVSWTARLAALGVKADLLIPDFLAISSGPVAHAGLVLAKTFTAEADLAAVLLEGEPTRAIATSDLLQEAYTTLLGAVPVNLLQGGYASRRDWGAIVRPWRRAAALAAGVVLAAIVSVAVEGARLNSQAEAATARAEAVFRAALPEVKRVVNPRAQMRAHLQNANLAGAGGFLTLSDVLVGATAAVADSEITSLRFDSKRGEIAATFSLSSFEAVERVKSEMTSRGGTVHEGGARQDGPRILADMTVRLR